MKSTRLGSASENMYLSQPLMHELTFEQWNISDNQATIIDVTSLESPCPASHTTTTGTSTRSSKQLLLLGHQIRLSSRQVYRTQVI